MVERRHRAPPGVDPEQAARIQRALDRVQERLMMAPPGLHQSGGAASVAACEAAGLPPAAAMLWMCVDGMEVGGETARIFPLAAIETATEQGFALGILREGDRVIGEYGRDLFVLPVDPYEEGADVVVVEQSGERLPEASSTAHLALGLLAETSVLFGDDGEFRDELFGDDGELTAATERRSLRRRLDVDPDAPRPRLRLAQHLHKAGELRAAASELKQVLRRAPQLPWAHEALGRVREEQGDRPGARRAYLEAATSMVSVDPQRAAYFRAHAARCAEGEERQTIAREVTAAWPEFAREQVDAARVLIDREAWEHAHDVVSLGLAVMPTQVELLALRTDLQTRSKVPPPVDRAEP